MANRDSALETTTEAREQLELTTALDSNSPARKLSDWDAIWARVGPLGLWQWFVIAIVGLSSYFGSQAIFMQAFVSTSFDHFCAPVELNSSSSTPQLPSDIRKFWSEIAGLAPVANDSQTSNVFDKFTESRWLKYKECFIPSEIVQHNIVGQQQQQSYSKCERYPFTSRPSGLSNSCVELLHTLASPTDKYAASPSTESSHGSELCHQWMYNKSSAQYGSSIQIDFDLVCDREWLRPFAQTITMLGQLVGVFVLGILSDNYGRRPAMTCAGILGMISCCAMAFAPNYWLFAAAKFVTTGSFTGTYTIGYVLAMEVVGGSLHRTIVGQAIWVPYVIGGYISLPLLAWWLPQWRTLVLAIGLPSILLLLNVCLLPESPRWLASKGCYSDALVVLQRAARINRRRRSNASSLPPPTDAEIDWEVLHGQFSTNRPRATSSNAAAVVSSRTLTNQTSLVDDAATDGHAPSRRASRPSSPLKPNYSNNNIMPSTTTTEQPAAVVAVAVNKTPLKRLLQGIRELFSRPLVRRRTLLLMCIWFVNSMVYYGLAFYSLQLPGNIFLNFAYGGIVEFPAYVFVILVYHYCGRRWPLAAVLVFCGIVNLTVAAFDAFGKVQEMGVLVIVLATMSKFFISCSYAMLWVYTAELMPTSVRNAGTGLCSMFGRLGSASAPQVQYVSRAVWPPLQLLLFGLLAIAAAVATVALPETNHHQIPQSVDEAECYKYNSIRRRRNVDGEINKNTSQ